MFLEMQLDIQTRAGQAVAVVRSESPVLTDLQSALDLLAEAAFGTGCRRLALAKSAVAEDFFALRTGLAGAVLEKFVQYGVKVAIWGDYTAYTSKPLRDFIRESNRGREVLFAASEEEALQWLTAR